MGENARVWRRGDGHSSMGTFLLVVAGVMFLVEASTWRDSPLALFAVAALIFVGSVLRLEGAIRNRNHPAA